MKVLLLKNRTAVSISILVLSFALLIPQYLWLPALSILMFLALRIFNKNIFIFLIIVSLLTLTSTLSVSIRTAIQVVSIITLFYFFFRYYGLDFPNYPKIPRELIILLFFIFISMIISTIFSDYVLLGIQQIIRLAVFLAIIYFIFSLTQDNSDVKFLLFALIAVGLIYSIIIFLELAKNNFNFIEMNLSQLEKMSNKYINMNSFGAFFIIIISMVFSFFLGRKEKLIKWSLSFFLCILFAGLFITNSRAAILAIFLSSIFVLYCLNKKLLKRILLLTLLILPILFIQSISNFIDVYFRLERLSTGRDVIFDVIYNVIKNNPILGVGPAATKYALYPNLDFMLGSPAEKFLAFHYDEIAFGHAHNFYLFFWSDLGVLGLFTSILLPIVFFKMCYKAIKKTKNINLDFYLLSIGITAAGLGLFIRGFFEWGNLISYGTIGIDLPFWILLVILSYINLNKINYLDKIFLSNMKIKISKSTV